MLWFFLYILVGGVLCFVFHYFADQKLGYHIFDFFKNNTIAILTGLFWPIVAPFTFGVLISNILGGKSND